MLDAGFCIIGLHRLDSSLGAGDGDCTEHDLLPILLLYIDVYKVPLAEAHSNILC
jgi:hypothetical protein